MNEQLANPQWPVAAPFHQTAREKKEIFLADANFSGFSRERFWCLGCADDGRGAGQPHFSLIPLCCLFAACPPNRPTARPPASQPSVFSKYFVCGRKSGGKKTDARARAHPQPHLHSVCSDSVLECAPFAVEKGSWESGANAGGFGPKIAFSTAEIWLNSRWF